MNQECVLIGDVAREAVHDQLRRFTQHQLRPKTVGKEWVNGPSRCVGTYVYFQGQRGKRCTYAAGERGFCWMHNKVYEKALRGDK